LRVVELKVNVGLKYDDLSKKRITFARQRETG
jgi:hypothetical protein